MAAKTVIFIIALLLGVSISLVSSEDSNSTLNTITTDPNPDPSTTSPNETSFTPNATSSTPNTTASKPNTDPTQTTPNGTAVTQTTTTPTTMPIRTTTPPSQVGTWTVTGGSNNQTCMKMTLKGTITKINADPILIPTTAVADSSSCDDEQANFVLEFEDDNMTSIAVTLSFVMQNEEKSYLWASSISDNGTTEQKVQILFETPIGNSYQCNKQMIPISDTFNLTLEDFKLQPFASFANYDFGKSYSCESSTSSGPHAAVIVGLVEGIIIIILLIAVVILYRKKKGPGRGYNNFT